MVEVRLARHADLPSLLDLFRVSEVSAAADSKERAAVIWHDTLSRPGLFVYVAIVNDRVVATCMLITAPNLLRAGRSHGFLENVMTHPACRGQGHGSAVVRAALTQAWAYNCHHVLLQSGRKDARVRVFYERCGFIPGMRTAYVARNPRP